MGRRYVPTRRGIACLIVAALVCVVWMASNVPVARRPAMAQLSSSAAGAADDSLVGWVMEKQAKLKSTAARVGAGVGGSAGLEHGKPIMSKMGNSTLRYAPLAYIQDSPDVSTGADVYSWQ